MFQDFTSKHVLFLVEHVSITLQLVAMAVAFGFVGSLAITALLRAPIRPLRWLAEGFVYIIQGTPIIIILFMTYFGLPRLGLSLPAFTAMAIAFMVFTSAFLGEIWRSSLDAVPRGQWEAVHSLGLGRVAGLVSIIAPQALRIATPPTIGFLVQLVKGTSVVSVIGITELTRAGQIVSNATFKPLPVFIVVAVLYFAINFPLTLLSRRLEKRMARHA